MEPICRSTFDTQQLVTDFPSDLPCAESPPRMRIGVGSAAASSRLNENALPPYRRR
jgi:hypothetical protein